jgi:hypothetical protein
VYQPAEGYVLASFDAPSVEAMTACRVSIQTIDRLTDVRLHRLQTTAEFVRAASEVSHDS